MNNLHLSIIFIILIAAAATISTMVVRSNSDSETINNLIIEGQKSHAEITRLNGELDYQLRLYDIQTGKLWALTDLLKDTMGEYIPEYERIISGNISQAKRLIRKERAK